MSLFFILIYTLPDLLIISPCSHIISFLEIILLENKYEQTAPFAVPVTGSSLIPYKGAKFLA